MTLGQDIARLRALPIFSEFQDEQLRLIAFSAEPLDLPAETVLFREGAAADGGYVVTSGLVRLQCAGEEGPVEKGRVGPGALIGELALLCPTTRPATAETVERSALMAISRRLLRRVFEEYPDMAGQLRQSLARRLHLMTTDLDQARRALEALDARG